jgi:dTDP-4-dehydrorhamnose reductase
LSNSGKILILGAGYLGNKIGNTLDEKGADVEVLASSVVNYHDKKTLWRALLNYSPDVVINCSGFTGRPNIDEAESKKEECWEYNVRSPLQVAKLCNQIGIKHIHVSSGCIYTGYEKDFTEKDIPNFGLWNDSSTYSKTKHAYEFLSKDLASKIVRIRMPISGDNARCYLSKIRNYDNLINFINSKTYIPDLCEFVATLIGSETTTWDEQDVYNVVNPEPLNTSAITTIMKYVGLDNPNWKFVDLADIPIVAPRSNCVLDSTKAESIMPLRTELEALIDLWQLVGLQNDLTMLGLPK